MIFLFNIINYLYKYILYVNTEKSNDKKKKNRNEVINEEVKYKEKKGHS